MSYFSGDHSRLARRAYPAKNNRWFEIFLRAGYPSRHQLYSIKPMQKVSGKCRRHTSVPQKYL